MHADRAPLPKYLGQVAVGLSDELMMVCESQQVFYYFL